MTDVVLERVHHWGCAHTNLTLCGEYKHLMEPWPIVRAWLNDYSAVITDLEQCGLCAIMLECFPARCPAGGFCTCSPYEPPEHNYERIGTDYAGVDAHRDWVSGFINDINQRWPM